MNSYFNVEKMKIPTRAAPPPPNADSSWSSSFFASKNVLKSTVSKKKAPPRPPPPKFAQTGPLEVCGSQLVAGLFPKRSQSRPIYEPVANLSNSGCLIDWSSPPSSPTSTTRSSSDALSVNSFGSDSVTPSSGSNSNVESGFEDDFELFPAPSSRLPDPWSPPIPAQPSTKLGNNWVSFSPNPPKKVTMPTIIRAKPERPKPPKILEKKLEMSALAEVFENVKMPVQSHNEAEDWSCDSPPMPSGPPPALPPEILSQLVADSERTELAKGRTKSGSSSMAIALFNYTGELGDLSFRQGDRIQILRKIDDNWYEAALGGRQGTAPANFLKLETNDARVVQALYTFIPETWEDLELQAGCQVRLLGRVNADWLYGEIGSHRGQFPATFVDQIPADLPPWST